MKVLFSHPTGNQNSRNVALALVKNKILLEFHTSIAFFKGNIITKVFKDFKKREFPIELKGYIKVHPFWELCRQLELKYNSFFRINRNYIPIEKVFNDFDFRVAIRLKESKPNVIYSYADTSLECFKIAKELNIYKIYDMHGCYWKKIEQISINEIYKQPEWASSINISKLSNDRKQRYSEEITLADSIIVASSFCKDSIPLNQDKVKTTIIPYGFPPVYFNRNYDLKNKNLKALFVGSISQLKGISYMFEAVEEYNKNIDLTLVGALVNTQSKILNEKLKQHNYLGVLPYSKVLEEMRKSDVLIFPSLLDAFGMVITEAMAQGTPVITTFNTAGPEIIVNNENGWIVEPGNSYEIKRVLEDILSNRSLIQNIGINAINCASRRTWVNYQNDISNFIIKQHNAI